MYRDTIIVRSLIGMDIHYIKPSESDLNGAMAVFTKWVDGKLNANVYKAFINNGQIIEIMNIRTVFC